MRGSDLGVMPIAWALVIAVGMALLITSNARFQLESSPRMEMITDSAGRIEWVEVEPEEEPQVEEETSAAVGTAMHIATYVVGLGVLMVAGWGLRASGIRFQRRNLWRSPLDDAMERAADRAVETVTGKALGIRQDAREAGEPTVTFAPVQRTLLSLRRDDPDLSVPVLEQLVRRLHVALLEAACIEDWDSLAPYAVPGVRRALSDALSAVDSVEDVLIGSVEFTVPEPGAWILIEVRLRGLRTERSADGPRRVAFEDLLVLRRSPAARSASPDVMLALGCPACGAPDGVDGEGRCRSCSLPVSWGERGWQVMDAQTLRADPTSREQAPRWLRLPAAVATADPDLQATLDAYAVFDPRFDPAALTSLARALGEAWWAHLCDGADPVDGLSEEALAAARFQRSVLAGCRLALVREDVRDEGLTLVAFDLDPWYATATFTVRVALREGLVARGGRLPPAAPARTRTERWTLVRALDGGDWELVRVAGE